MNIAFPGATECLDGEDFAFFHLRLISALDDGHTLAAVDLPLTNVVAGQIADGFDRICLASDLNFVTLHGLLYGRANVTDADINTSFLYGTSGVHAQ